jgi:hypothetical protein
VGWLKTLIQKEPTALVSLVRYAILIGIAYGLHTTNDQLALILGFVELLLWIANRAMVTPVSQVNAQVTQQVNEQVDAAVEDALTAEAEPMTDEQRQLVTDLREILTTLKAERRGR